MMAKDTATIKDTTSACESCMIITSGSVIVLFLCLFSMWSFQLYVYETRIYNYHGPGQLSTRYIRKHLDVYTCYAYDVTPWLPADVYVVQGQAELLPGSTKVVKRQTRELLPHSPSRNNAFYLLEGSNIAATACKTKHFSMERKVELLLLKGDNSWQKWINDDCDDCRFRKVVLNQNDYCGKNAAVLTHTVQERGTYYIVLTGASPEEVSANLEVHCTTFDLRHAHRLCKDSYQCMVDMVYGSNFDIVIDFTDDKVASAFSLTCHRRLVCIVVFFILCTTSGHVTILLFIYCCTLCRSNSQNGKVVKGQKRNVSRLVSEEQKRV